MNMRMPVAGLRPLDLAREERVHARRAALARALHATTHTLLERAEEPGEARAHRADCALEVAALDVRVVEDHREPVSRRNVGFASAERLPKACLAALDAELDEPAWERTDLPVLAAFESVDGGALPDLVERRHDLRVIDDRVQA